MSLIEIKEYKSNEIKSSSALINPNHIVTIRKSNFNDKIWHISFLNEERISVDEVNLKIITDHNKSIINTIFG